MLTKKIFWILSVVAIYEDIDVSVSGKRILINIWLLCLLY